MKIKMSKKFWECLGSDLDACADREPFWQALADKIICAKSQTIDFTDKEIAGIKYEVYFKEDIYKEDTEDIGYRLSMTRGKARLDKIIGVYREPEDSELIKDHI